MSDLKIDLSGPHGNSFYIMGLTQNLGKQLGLSQEEINKIINEMKSAGYDNLVKVFAKNFGMIVKIYDGDKLYDWETAYLDG